MIDEELDPYLERIVRAAQRPVPVDLAAKARLLAAVRAEPAFVGAPRHSTWRWFVDRNVSLSPLGSFAIAAGLVALGAFLAVSRTNRDGLSTGQPRAVAAADGQLPVSTAAINQRFVYVAPQAKSVSLVGDFNQWNPTATPLVRAHGNGPWMVALPLDAGRHQYSFVVDGHWASDPSAPLAPDDGFGHASSVVVVTGGSAL